MRRLRLLCAEHRKAGVTSVQAVAVAAEVRTCFFAGRLYAMRNALKHVLSMLGLVY